MLRFGSTYVYNYNLSDEESISDDEFDEGLNLVLTSTARVGKGKIGTPQSTSKRGQPGRDGRGGGTSRDGVFGRFFGRLSKRSTDGDRGDEYERGQSKRSTKHGKHRFRRADTNVVTVKFESLIKPTRMHTGEVEGCGSCNAILSHLSKVTHTNQQDEKQWLCEFCGQTNMLDLMPEEIPKEDDITYMLQPAPCTTTASTSGVDKSLVVFCIDISGSMCVTTEVPGKLNLRGDTTSRLQGLNTEHENQFLPGQSRNVTHVSRLQGLQAAVDHQLEEMLKEHPNRCVALIAFNNEVVIYGDGSHEPVHLAEHNLKDKDNLTKMGSEAQLPKAIKDTRNKLGDTIFSLEEGGPTALGPALMLSVALAGQVTGSKVILCTDGKANVGLGSLDTEDLESAKQFYEELSAISVSKGVSVSVTTIKGTDCRMEDIGAVADATGGQVNIVDPLCLTREFGNILADRIIATNVKATFLTHKGLYIRENESQENHLVRDIGNVTEKSEITFEYGVKGKGKKHKKVHKTKACNYDSTDEVGPYVNIPNNDADAASNSNKTDAIPIDTSAATDADYINVAGETNASKDVEVSKHRPKVADLKETSPKAISKPIDEVVPRDEMDIDNMDELPFQLQIMYTDLDGTKALRVITQSKPITTQRDLAVQYMNVGVLGVHAAQTSAMLAQDGMYKRARLHAHTSHKLVKSHIESEPVTDEVQDIYTSCYTNVGGLERQLNKVQQTEAAAFGADLDEMDEENGRRGYSAPRAIGHRQLSIKAMRSNNRDDSLANITYQMKKYTNTKSVSKE